MNKGSRNLTMIGGALAVTLFLCGLFHVQIMAFWHSDDGAVAMEAIVLGLVCFVAPATIFVAACWCVVICVSNIRKLLAK